MTDNASMLARLGDKKKLLVFDCLIFVWVDFCLYLHLGSEIRKRVTWTEGSSFPGRSSL